MRVPLRLLARRQLFFQLLFSTTTLSIKSH
jgi:hypothetical protein